MLCDLKTTHLLVEGMFEIQPEQLYTFLGLGFVKIEKQKLVSRVDIK